MEEISATALQPTSNESLMDGSGNVVLAIGTSSDSQHICAAGPQSDITVPQRGRKPKRKILEPQKQGCDQEKKVAPTRPQRRKDSLTPVRKQKPSDVLVGTPQEVTPVPSVPKVAVQTLSTESDITPLCSINKEIPTVPVPPVTLRGRKRTTESSAETTKDNISERTSEVSSLPVPKPRVKKRLSGAFPDEITFSGQPSACQTEEPDRGADSLGQESVKQNEQLSAPVPLPRNKKHLSLTDSTPTTDNAETELPESSPEDTCVTSEDTEKDSTLPDSNVIAEQDLATSPGKESTLEQEVLAAMSEEEFPEAQPVEDAKKTVDEVIEGWTLTDKPVNTNMLEKGAEKCKEEKSLASYVVSSQDDWLHVENNKDNEPMKLNSKEDIKEEDLEFGFVSIDVVADLLEEER